MTYAQVCAQAAAVGEWADLIALTAVPHINGTAPCCMGHAQRRQQPSQHLSSSSMNRPQHTNV